MVVPSLPGISLSVLLNERVTAKVTAAIDQVPGRVRRLICSFCLFVCLSI